MSLKGRTKNYKNILQEKLLLIEKREEDGILPAHILEKKTFILS
jgi:hypothetical protein